MIYRHLGKYSACDCPQRLTIVRAWSGAADCVKFIHWNEEDDTLLDTVVRMMSNTSEVINIAGSQVTFLAIVDDL